MSINFRIVIFSIYTLLPLGLLAREPITSVDSLKQIVRIQRGNGELTKAIATNNRIIKLCADLNLNDELADAYMTAGNLFSNQSRYEDSFHYIKLALQVPGVKNSIRMRVRAFGEFGRNYYGLGFYKSSEDSYTQGLKWADKISDPNLRTNSIVYLHGLRSFLYETQKLYSKSLKDLQTAYSIRPNPLLASRIAKHYTVFDWNQDSAMFYLQQAEKFIKRGEATTYQQSIVLRNQGRYYSKIGQFDAALETLARSLEISEVLGKPITLLDTYELIHEVAMQAGDAAKQQLALREIKRLNDSLHILKSQAIEIPLSQAKQYYAEQQERRLYISAAITTIIVSIAIFFFMRLHRRQKSKVNEKINEYVHQADFHSKLIEKAHQNSPDFLVSFAHQYPQFIEKLKEYNSDVTSSELTFCAMTFLDLTTKEIASATYVTVRAVQVRKNRLRKKYNIDSSVDFNRWTQNLV